MKCKNIDIKKLQKFCKIMKKMNIDRDIWLPQNHKKRTKAINIVKRFLCVEELLVKNLVESIYFQGLVKYYAKNTNFQHLNSNAFNWKIENKRYNILIITFLNTNFKLELEI